MTEQQKYLKWYERAKENGLVDIRFYVGDVSRASKEDFFREANNINSALEEGKVNEDLGFF